VADVPARDDQRRAGTWRAPRCAGILGIVALVALVWPAGAAQSAQGAAARKAVTLPGAILIADRGNNRILLVNQAGRQLWLFPTRHDQLRGLRLNYDDDAFVGFGGTKIVANEEDVHTIVSIDIRTHDRVHLFGTPGVRGNGANLLNTPDDAYPLPDGSVTVADAYNCRVLWIRSHRITRQLGQDGVCRHDPPNTFGALNGDTPLPGGGLLLSEIPGHYVDEISPSGALVWSVAAPVSYPSDPQPLPGGRVLLADYADPGQVIIMNRFGRVLWRYGPASGAGRLNHPSLALPLPGGLIAINDDYRDRVVVVSMLTHKIVWQYGHTDVPGSTPGYLRIPDGMDFVPLNAAGAPRWGAVHHP
jgi:hypothetical protein